MSHLEHNCIFFISSKDWEDCKAVSKNHELQGSATAFKATTSFKALKSCIFFFLNDAY